MSNPAQEEADRLFSNKTHVSSHPEDRDNSDREPDSELKDARRGIRTGRLGREADSDDDRFDDERAAGVTNSSSKANYTLPSTTRYANTGPKGVIADAQNYHRSKRRALRQTFDKVSNNVSLGSKPKRNAGDEKNNKKNRRDDSGSSQDEEDELDDDEDEFMQQWRQQRFAELKKEQQQTSHQRNVSPSVRSYGRLDAVDATGYLDAIEKCPSDAVVAVLLYDHTSAHSGEVEAELERLAYRYSHVHFVKLPHDVAEMETVDIPAVLAYRNGDVFATISGAESEGLENVLKSQGVLMRRGA